MPNPYYHGYRPSIRAMMDIERTRYNAVLAAGWRYSHARLVWEHPDGRRGLNQHVIYDCMVRAMPLPPCGNTRDETPADTRRVWTETARRLRAADQRADADAREYEGYPLSGSEVTWNWMVFRDAAARDRARAGLQRASEDVTDRLHPAVARVARGGMARHGRSQTARSKDQWQPNMWEA